MQYVIALASFLVVSCGLAGVVFPSAVGQGCWMGLLAVLALQVVHTACRWRSAFWKSYLPALATSGILVGSPLASRAINHELLLYRFHSHRDEYEAVADRIAQQGYPERLQPSEEHLAHSVLLLPAGSPAFVVIPDARVGSLGFARIEDRALVHQLSATSTMGTSRNPIELIEGNWYLFAR